MTYEEARRKARMMFGAHADVKIEGKVDGTTTTRIFAVGVWLRGDGHKTDHKAFKILGAGLNWEEAFEHAEKIK